MEYVGKFENIEFYNDAIATIPQATINCLKTLGEVDTLICGGMDRGVSQQELIDYLKESNVRNIICMPETGEQIYKGLENIKNVYRAETIEEAVKLSKKVTNKNAKCVLSPSASSYSHFKNFEEKGRLFKECVKGNIK
jgi:UDP-N-acetylmuramoylalanine--D-glutamate ligase